MGQQKWEQREGLGSETQKLVWAFPTHLNSFSPLKKNKKNKYPNNPEVQTASVVLQTHWFVMKARLLELKLRKALKVTLPERNNAWIVRISYNRHKFPFYFSGLQF